MKYIYFIDGKLSESTHKLKYNTFALLKFQANKPMSSYLG